MGYKLINENPLQYLDEDTGLTIEPDSYVCPIHGGVIRYIANETVCQVPAIEAGCEHCKTYLKNTYNAEML